MSNPKKPFTLQTAFAEYEITELLGEGGAGRVFGGTTTAGDPIAIKVLTNARRDKRQRFKNEISFLSRNEHPNIVSVKDYGVSDDAIAKGPFYVMPRYAGSLRDLMAKSIPASSVLQHFSQIIDGVEAAHLKNVQHRDLKPENILHVANGRTLAIADFGIARFTERELLTLVETGPEQRLANFQYAAPEQRARGAAVTAAADIYALGLILNEMFTGAVPHGTDYRTIASVAQDYGYLDAIVAHMLKQNPTERPGSIAAIKGAIAMYAAEAVSLQRLSKISNTVIKAGEIDEPLAYNEVKVIGAEYTGSQLVLTLDREVNENWVLALCNMGNYTSVMGADPQRFQFRGNKAFLATSEHSLQTIIDYFKAWMPKAMLTLRNMLEQDAKAKEQERQRKLTAERAAEEQRLQINRSLRV